MWFYHALLKRQQRKCSDQRKEGLFLSCMYSSCLKIPDMLSCPVQVQADVHVVLFRCVPRTRACLREGLTNYYHQSDIMATGDKPTISFSCFGWELLAGIWQNRLRRL